MPATARLRAALADLPASVELALSDAGARA